MDLQKFDAELLQKFDNYTKNYQPSVDCSCSTFCCRIKGVLLKKKHLENVLVYFSSKGNNIILLFRNKNITIIQRTETIALNNTHIYLRNIKHTQIYF